MRLRGAHRARGLMLVFGVSADKKSDTKGRAVQRTALRNNSSRELPGVNVFIHLFGTKKDSAHQTWLDFTGHGCWAFNGNQSQLE